MFGLTVLAETEVGKDVVLKTGFYSTFSHQARKLSWV